MKKLFLVLLASVLMFGCVSQEAQVANPASVFCEARGGTLDIATAVDGSQAGYCTLAIGERCEEWAYYRGECPVASPVPSPECNGHGLGDSWKQDCNTCSCTENGAVCTLMACVTPSPSPLTKCEKDSDCVVGGCSSQLCVLKGQLIASTCEWADYYSCFQRDSVQSTCGCANNACVWDANTLGCVAAMRTPSPIPSPVSQASDDFAKFKDYEQHYLRLYLNYSGFTMRQEFYQYYERWTGDYKPPLMPNSYGIQLRKKNDYNDPYGKSRTENGVSMTWSEGGSTVDTHWLEFKCGEYQFWAQTPMMNSSVFETFANATTYACGDYLANK